jgi:glycosyltransferase involved in cell wall biosynthesis
MPPLLLAQHLSILARNLAGAAQVKTPTDLTCAVMLEARATIDNDRPNLVATSKAGTEVAILTGGADKPYALGLATTLMSQGVALDLIGGDELNIPAFRGASGVNFLNLRGDQRSGVSFGSKASRVLAYYGRLLRYAATAEPRMFHILWNNKFEVIDRTLLMLYYKGLRKKIALTVHNVNAGKRDGNDSLLNRATLRVQYHLADHIFVHTASMKTELVEDFGVRDSVVSVIPFGINATVPNTALTPAQARKRLGIAPEEKTMLFFGSIAPYKGLEYLISALPRLRNAADYRLIIAGSPKAGFETYWEDVRRAVNQNASATSILQKIEFVPDEETELYFKAADVLVLPYRHIFQSGVLFLAYNFGLPVLAADVGSLSEDVLEGRTGFMFRPEDPTDLARAIETYFASELFKALPERRRDIRCYANEKHSWDTVGGITRNVYAELLERQLGLEGS